MRFLLLMLSLPHSDLDFDLGEGVTGLRDGWFDVRDGVVGSVEGSVRKGMRWYAGRIGGLQGIFQAEIDGDMMEHGPRNRDIVMRLIVCVRLV